MFKKLLSLSALVILTGCMGNSTSSGGSNTNPVSIQQSGIMIDPMTSVPVINGSSTQGTLYIHNYSDQAISGLKYSLNNPTLTSQVKSVLSRAGLSIGGGIEDKSGFVLLNPERCVSIGANSSCSINFTTPSLSFGNSGNSLVSINYRLPTGKSTSTSQVVNYNYVDGKSTSGINFSGSLEVNGAVGSTKYIVGYIYAGGVAGSLYKGVNLNSSNPSTRISGGFINNQEVATNQVIAVEFAVAVQSTRNSYVTVTPTWDDSSTNITTAAASANGVPLGISLVPGQNVVNYLFGNVPILVVGVNTQAVINVVNNGNSNSADELIVEKDGGQADDLSIDASDCQMVLESNAGNACIIGYTLTGNSSGGTTLIYKDSAGTEVGRQDVYWLSDDYLPVVKVTPSTRMITFEQSTTSGLITFTLQNIGTASLDDLTYPVTVTGVSTWTQTSSDCSESLAVGSSCSIRGTLSGAAGGSGQLYAKAMGSYSNTSYSFVSLPISYAVGDFPELSLSPSGVQTLSPIVADGLSTESITYTLSNASGAPAATITSISLAAMSKSANPQISGGTCTIGGTVDFGNDCTVIVTFGPVPTSESQSFNDGVTQLNIGYSGGTPVTITDVISSGDLEYSLQGNDSILGLVISVNGMTGNGRESNPYSATALNDNIQLALIYTNLSDYYTMDNLNFDVNSLPYGISVSGDCPTGSSVISLPPNGGCTLNLNINKNLLKTSSQGGSVVLDLTTPMATWNVTDMGVYEQSGQMLYINYLQPSVTFNLSNNNAYFESTVLTMTLANESAGTTPVVVDVSQVKAWLVDSPVATSNCTVENSDYSTRCSLGGVLGESAQVTYIMPSYLNLGESANIPLVYSSDDLVYLASTYDFIQLIMPPPPLAFIKISTNANFSCALGNDGKVYCWGKGDNGQIGNGANSNVNVPTLVNMPNDVTFTSILTNGSFSCALSSDGKAYCWGIGFGGQIGNGADSNVNVPTEVTMPDDVIFISLSTNDNFSCALGDNYKVYCWGKGDNGQIGNGADSNVNVPTLVTMPDDVTFTSISSNSNFSCAVGDNYKAYCWGNGFFGQVGNGANSNVNVPTEVTMSPEMEFLDISTNSNFSCALGVSSGYSKTYCWGDGQYGQIGNEADTSVNIPTEVSMPIGVTFTQISTNTYFSCALGDNDKTYCWGYGGSGQIGDGANSNVNVPTEVTMPPEVAFISISTNNNFSCALSHNKKAYCWGAGLNGEIGNGTNDYVNAPALVNMPSGVMFTSVSTNSSFSCALSSDGKAYCWGKGDNGQIGNGANSSVNTPTAVVMP